MKTSFIFGSLGLLIALPALAAQTAFHDGDQVKFYVDEFTGGARYCLGTVAHAYDNGSAELTNTLPEGCAQDDRTYKLNRLFRRAKVVQLVDRINVGDLTLKVGGFAMLDSNPLSYMGLPCILKVKAITSTGDAVFESVAEDDHCGADITLTQVTSPSLGGAFPYTPVEFVREVRSRDGRVLRVGDHAGVNVFGLLCSGRVQDILSNGYVRISGGDCPAGRWIPAKDLGAATASQEPRPDNDASTNLTAQ